MLSSAFLLGFSIAVAGRHVVFEARLGSSTSRQPARAELFFVCSVQIYFVCSVRIYFVCSVRIDFICSV